MTTHVRRRSLVQSAFINTTKYDLSKESDRRASFIENGYSNEAISIEDLALMGFYFYKRPDVVKCVFCYVTLEHFESGDTALGEHLKFSPNCPLLAKRRSTGNVPMDDKVFRQRVPSVSSFDECGSKKARKNSKQELLEYPEYRLLQKRLNSFETWPVGIKQKPLELANAGFFYSGQSDLVICFTCGVYINQLENTDNPWVEHKRLATKECNYLALNQEIVKKEEEKYEQFKNLQATENEITALSINDKEEDSFEKKEAEPNFETVCKICLERKSQVIFLPCRHVAVCGSCVFGIDDKCPICRTEIKEKIQLYYA